MAKPQDCRYLKSHEWVHIDGPSAVVGISDHAQKEITDVVFVEMPKIGAVVSQGKPCAVIESVKAAFDIYAPLSGEIIAVNESVTKDPSLVNRSSHDEGWLFKIKPSNPAEQNNLMDYAGYQTFLSSAAAH